MKKPRLTAHRYGADMLCSMCSLGFTYRHESCEGATSAGRAEIRRRLEAERQGAIQRQAEASARHFAELAQARRSR